MYVPAKKLQSLYRWNNSIWDSWKIHQDTSVIIRSLHLYYCCNSLIVSINDISCISFHNWGNSSIHTYTARAKKPQGETFLYIWMTDWHRLWVLSQAEKTIATLSILFWTKLNNFNYFLLSLCLVKNVANIPKVIYTKCSKHWTYAVAHTINCENKIWRQN